MPAPKPASIDLPLVLRKIALRFPDVEQGIACKGTALECSTFKTRRKSFLFIGKKDAKVKLSASQAEFATFISKEPGRYKIGANGWATIAFAGDSPLPFDLLEKWVDESYQAIANKQKIKSKRA